MNRLFFAFVIAATSTTAIAKKPEHAGNGKGSNKGDAVEPAPKPSGNKMLDAVNAVRATGTTCGGEWKPPVHPLTWNNALEDAASYHVNDMANYDYFSHTGLDGSTPSTRAAEHGYQGPVGENIAAGTYVDTVEEVMDLWLGSAGHCSNLMSSFHTEMGAASARNRSSRYVNYWAQVFGRPSN